jgi:hypothetical protein
MAATSAVIAEWWAGTAATGAVVEGGTVVAAGTAGTAGAGAGIAGAAATAAGTAAGTALVGELLKPDVPAAQAQTRMPDPLEQEQARKRSLLEQMSRRGRASTIMTGPTGGTLGG